MMCERGATGLTYVAELARLNEWFEREFIISRGRRAVETCNFLRLRANYGECELIRYYRNA